LKSRKRRKRPGRREVKGGREKRGREDKEGGEGGEGGEEGEREERRTEGESAGGTYTSPSCFPSGNPHGSKSASGDELSQTKREHINMKS